jgi:hypothetical protein
VLELVSTAKPLLVNADVSQHDGRPSQLPRHAAARRGDAVLCTPTFDEEGEYNAVDHAAFFSKELGKEVKVVNVPVSEASKGMQQRGMGASMANLYQEMYEGALSGLLGVEPGHRVEKGSSTLEEAIGPYLAR